MRYKLEEGYFYQVATRLKPRDNSTTPDDSTSNVAASCQQVTVRNFVRTGVVTKCDRRDVAFQDGSKRFFRYTDLVLGLMLWLGSDLLQVFVCIVSD